MRDTSGTLLGVFAVDIPLDFLSDDGISGLIGKHRVVIVESTGLIVATTHGSTSYMSSSGVKTRLNCMSSDDATIQKYSQIISQKYNEFTQAWNVRLTYKSDTVTVSKISVPGMDWTMLLIVPVEEYVSTLEQNNELAVTLLVIIIFMVVLLLQSYVADRELRHSAEELEGINCDAANQICQDDPLCPLKMNKSVKRMQTLLKDRYKNVSRDVLYKTAGLYLMYAYQGMDVYGLIQIESLNQGTWLAHLFLYSSNWYWKFVVNLNLISLVFFEFWEWGCDGNIAAEQNMSVTNDANGDHKIWLGVHVCALIIVTLDLVLKCVFKCLKHKGRKYDIHLYLGGGIFMYGLLWVTFILREYCILEEACGYVKPLLLFFKWRSLQATVKMFGKSIANSFAVFMLLALCISMTALAMLIVFRGEFDGDHTLNGFVESLVEMFVFMASGENYIELVNQARSINGFYVLLYIAAGFIGLVVIMSLVLATFQQDYEQQLGAAGIVKSRIRTRALTVSYCLGTLECSGEFGSNIKYDNFVEMMNCFENAKNEKARNSQSGASVFPILFPDMPALPPTSATIDPDNDGDNSAAFARTSLNRQNSAIEAEDTWHFLFNLLNADDDDGVDFSEFEYVFYLHQLISYVRESPQLSFMVRLERVEAELKKRTAIHKKSQEHNDVTLLKDTKNHLTQKLLDAQEVASYGVQDGLISLRAWDRLALVLVLFHMFVIVLAFSRKITSLTTEPFEVVLYTFPFYYCFEIANRAWQHGGIENLWSNPEQPTVQFMHRIDCSVSFTSLLCVMIMLIMDATGNARPRMLNSWPTSVWCAY